MARIYSFITGLLSVIPGALLVVSDDGRIRRSNHAAAELLGYSEADLSGSPLKTIFPDFATTLARYLVPGNRDTGPTRVEANFVNSRGENVPVFLSADAQYSADSDDTAAVSIVLVAMDLSERRKLEVELRHAQKLESIGQLAAGVAHEINTPMQFIGDNIGFVADSIPELMRIVDAGRGLLESTPESRVDAERALLNAAAEADLEFLRNRLPRAIQRAQEGVDRVKRIIEAMKVFSHPNIEMEPLDLNKLIENTLVLTANEYKYCASVQTDLQPLPTVPGRRTDLTQVLINLITNSAYAIGEFYHGSQQGQISIRTRAQDDIAEIEIEDDGSGIPESIRTRVFDPFFTTKPVGKGTGQGLSISRSIIVNGHHGKLLFEPVQPHGTRFRVQLPLHVEGV